MAISETSARSDSNKIAPLRFITCGNVDDGKSTLIGRLLWDTKSVPSDQRSLIEAQRVKSADGTDHPDFANLLDGLQAEREQGITIDVAYRYFATPARAFIVADTPGHEQYTRNMVTGASTAQLAVLLVDAQTGLTEQTRRHALIASLMGIGNLILVVNKMDLVGYDRLRFDAVARDFSQLGRSLDVRAVTAIPAAALVGHNVVSRGTEVMDWYDGPTLLEALEAAETAPARRGQFRLCVQRVSRPNEAFRGFQGAVRGGTMHVGQRVTVLPSGLQATVTGLETFDGPLDLAPDGQAVTVVLDRKIDIAKGDFIVDAAAPLQTTTRAGATVLVLDDAGLVAGKRYWLKTQSHRRRVRIVPQSSIDLSTGEWRPDRSMRVNQIIQCTVQFEQPGFLDRFGDSRDSGSFILIDPDDHATVAGGMVTEPVASDHRADLDEDRQVQISMPEDLARLVLELGPVKERMAEIRLETV